MKLCFWIALVGTSPIWIFFVLQFVAPALKGREQRLVIPFLLLSLTFLLLGSLFAFFVTIPIANEYLYAFNQGIGINLWTLSNYLDYTLIVLLANALGFELCVLLFFLVHFRFVSAQTLKEKRRLMVVCAFAVSAILTPPDILTQIMLALPLIGFYELSILYANIRTKQERRLLVDKELPPQILD